MISAVLLWGLFHIVGLHHWHVVAEFGLLPTHIYPSYAHTLMDYYVCVFIYSITLELQPFMHYSPLSHLSFALTGNVSCFIPAETT